MAIVNKTYLLLTVTFLFSAIVMTVGLAACLADSGSGEEAEAGKSVNPSEVSEHPGETHPKPQAAPNPYTEDVTRVKQIWLNSELPQSTSDSEGNGEEAEKSQ
jgi:hypothetical protein